MDHVHCTHPHVQGSTDLNRGGYPVVRWQCADCGRALKPRECGMNPRALGTNPLAKAKVRNKYALRNWKRAQRR